MTYLTGCCFGLNCGAHSAEEMSVLCCLPASLHSCCVPFMSRGSITHHVYITSFLTWGFSDPTLVWVQSEESFQAKLAKWKPKFSYLKHYDTVGISKCFLIREKL